jgi:hypothetical protein
MKVVCIDDSRIDNGSNYGSFSSNLTKDKIYDVIIKDKTSYVIIDDLGMENGFYKHRFEKLDKIRNEKISKLLEK